MSLKQIQNKPNRSAFDLSFRKCFTAKVGEILPVGFKEVIPGDKFKIKLNSFTRTQPVNSAAFTRIKEYYDYFFVPYRLLWRYFDQFITQTSTTNPQYAKDPATNQDKSLDWLPYILPSDLVGIMNYTSTHSPKNEFGFDRSILMFKLLKYLGYGLLSVSRPNNSYHYGYSGKDSSSAGEGNIFLNPFPILAYQKICQDYFRNTQWENANPSTCNIDYMNGTNSHLNLLYLQDDKRIAKRNMLDLNYCTWDKDLFTGLLPSPQYGDTATIGGFDSDTLPFEKFTVPFDGFDATDHIAFGNFNVSSNVNELSSSNPLLNGKFNSSGVTDGNAVSLSNGKIKLSASQISGFNVLALRQAEALQKWREISLSGRQDYKDQIEKHFGVTVPEVRSNLCSWLGGNTSIIDIGEVVNTNLQGINESGSSVGADIAGRGVGSSSHNVDFTATEHGLIMCLYHAVPLMDYSDEVTDLYMFKTRMYDFAIPEFDSVGMQSVPGIALNSVFSTAFSTPDTKDPLSPTSNLYNSIGYAPRYVDYKTSVDIVTGDFCDTMKYWAAPMSSDYFKKLSSIGAGQLSPAFFKCNPSLLDTIFAVNATGDYRTDNLLVSAFQDIKVVRNLDYNGLPY